MRGILTQFALRYFISHFAYRVMVYDLDSPVSKVLYYFSHCFTNNHSQVYTTAKTKFFEGLIFIFTGTKTPGIYSVMKMHVLILLCRLSTFRRNTWRKSRRFSQSTNKNRNSTRDTLFSPSVQRYNNLFTAAFLIIICIVLIADKERRTLKYLLAIATGTPCLHHNWVKHCAEQVCDIPLCSYSFISGMRPSFPSLSTSSRIFSSERGNIIHVSTEFI